MSELPVGWVEAPLSTVAEWGSGGTPKAGNTAYYGGSIPWAVIGDLTDGVVSSTANSITKLGLANSSAKMVDADVVMIAMYGSIGKLGLPDKPMATNQAIAFARGRDGVLTRKYLFYYLMHVREKLAAAGKGATQQNISQTILKAWRIPIAPLDEQEGIVAAIEEQLSRLDAGIAALERIRHNLKRMRAAVLREAVAAGERDGAELVALGDMVVPERKMAYGVLVPGDDVLGGVPFVRVGDLVSRSVRTDSLKRIDPSVAARYPRTRLQGGEVLLSLVGTIGRTAIVPAGLAGANAARALAVIPARPGVEPRYVAIALSRSTVKRDLSNLAHEVARKTLNLEDVRRYVIPLPSYERQLAIVETVESAEAWITTIEGLIDNAIHRSGHLKSSVLASAFSGNLMTQDEADTPAQTLLDCITAERAASRSDGLARNKSR